MVRLGDVVLFVAPSRNYVKWNNVFVHAFSSCSFGWLHAHRDWLCSRGGGSHGEHRASECRSWLPVVVAHHGSSPSVGVFGYFLPLLCSQAVAGRACASGRGLNKYSSPSSLLATYTNDGLVKYC